MTVDEFKRWLDTAPPEEKKPVKIAAGMGTQQDQVCFDAFVSRSKYEFHVALGVPTEEDKLSSATMWYARWGFWLIVASVLLGIASVVLSLISLRK